MKQFSIIILLAVFYIIFPYADTHLFPQVEQQPQTQQPEKPQKEAIISLARMADITHFQNANHFYKLKEYGKAIELFTEYLEIYFNGAHRKEAHKTIGAIYFEEFNYIRSIKAYQSLYEEFSNSEEGVEAYYMMGICNQKMGFMDKAKAIFKSIIEQHPESNYAYQAKIKLDLFEILESDYKSSRN